MNASRWTKDGIIHGFDEKNRRVTAKYSTDGEDVLIARGHVQDIQQEVDHVHAWNQKTGEPGHHDMRHSRKMFPQVKDNWAVASEAKEKLISRAEQLATTTDWKKGGEEFKSLLTEWKAVGRGEKSADAAQWERFKAAREKFNSARSAYFEKRQCEWASNKAAKERLIYQMSLLVNYNDYRAAKDQARQLDTQWRAIGPCAKEDRDRLWQQYKSAKDQLFEAAKRAGEQRKAEARQRAQERVWRLEEQLRNVENALQRAEENYSRALSARSPSMRNPHWREISQKQLDRQSAARQKVQSIQQRRSEVIQKLGDARSRLNQF